VTEARWWNQEAWGVDAMMNSPLSLSLSLSPSSLIPTNTIFLALISPVKLKNVAPKKNVFEKSP